jgi:drug/metabolite transporter (DMT)-like permease
MAAVFLYAVQNVALELSLAEENTFKLLAIMYVIMLPMATASWWYTSDTEGFRFMLDDTSKLGLIVIIGIVYFFADTSFVSAYTVAEGNVLTITTIVIMFPLFATLIKYGFTGALPNIYQFAGYALGALAVWLMSYGDKVAG